METNIKLEGKGKKIKSLDKMEGEKELYKVWDKHAQVERRESE